MTKEEFKTRWESSDNGGGITYEQVAQCAVEWNLIALPKITSMDKVLYTVLKAANTNDFEEYNPINFED